MLQKVTAADTWTEVIRLAEGTGFSDQLLPLRRRERQRVGQGPSQAVGPSGAQR